MPQIKVLLKRSTVWVRRTPTVVAYPQNYAEAVRLYQLAAGQGYAIAQHDLGAMYYNGEGVAQDYVRALMWFSLAASAETGAKAEQVAEVRDATARRMTPAQIAEAQRLTREWKPKTWEELRPE